MPYGTLTVPDLVRSSFQNILDYGEGRLFAYIDRLLVSYNAITDDLMGQYADPTTDRIMGYGGGTGVQMVKTNEHGRADASKPTFGNNMAVPLELNQASTQWTAKWFENHSPDELTAVVEDMMLVDTQQRQKDLKNALFGSSNRTFLDNLVDGYSLGVKALANADGFALPPDPYGAAVDGSTHTHYLARVGTLAASDVDGVIATVAAHFNRGKTILMINAAQEATLRAFNAAGQFVYAPPPNVQTATTVTVTQQRIDVSQTNNTFVGIWGTRAVEVWVKPWVPANYMIAMQVNAGTKALAMRTRRPGSGGLRMVAEFEHYPLRAKTFESEYGFGVADRLAAAVLYIGATSYSDPTF